MDQPELERLLESARRIAREAGAVILAAAAGPLHAAAKQDGSPLTRADLASHELILSRLEALRPAFPIISEEGNLATSASPAPELLWLVDPLDGTKEFLAGLDEYTVNIALIERGRPILGAISVPPAGTLYYAAEGLGAWKTEADGPARRIAPAASRQPRRAVVSRSHLSGQTEEFLARLNVGEVIRRGSSLKLCAVAEGAADIYPRFGPTCLWDTAAGAAIALEAGCKVVDLLGKDLRYDPSSGLKHAGFIVHPAGMILPLGREAS